MRTAAVLDGWNLNDDQGEYQCVIYTFLNGYDAYLIDGDRWCKDNENLFFGYLIVVLETQLDGCLQLTHLSSSHSGANRSLDFWLSYFALA